VYTGATYKHTITKKVVEGLESICTYRHWLLSQATMLINARCVNAPPPPLPRPRVQTFPLLVSIRVGACTIEGPDDGGIGGFGWEGGG